ncbi:hypothetical protein MRBLMN1_001019 [Chitinophaga ginsengisegetis]|uniref:hypothetical protein n=1 Tax=Chitinophaga ginsengisegetis TaxID=393003 RepID=UPI0034318437
MIKALELNDLSYVIDRNDNIDQWYMVEKTATYGEKIPVIFCPNSMINIKPVPLSLRWLEGFGFKKADTNFIAREYNGLLIDENFQLCSQDPLEGNKIITGNTIRFVHQLQNAYYSWAGKELEIRVEIKNVS